jgi:hypothetical protein
MTPTKPGRRPAAWLPGLGALLLIAGLAEAAEREVRQFTVWIDKKQAGSYQMVIDRLDDGTTKVTANADVKISYLIYTYRYSYRGTEVWKDGRLLRMDTGANDNGKQFSLSARTQTDGLHVQVNGKGHLTRADAWPTTYWRLPEKSLRDQPLTVLDADTGRPLNGRLEDLGAASIRVGRQAQDCTHYRLTGSVTAELWYDAQERLVRQESVEDGHRTVLELVSVRR